MAKIVTIYWRDIPSKVVARRGRESISTNLSLRFQKALNRAAMRAGKGGSHDYIEDWRRDTERVTLVAEGSESDVNALQSAVDARINALESAYSDQRLDDLARNKGRESENEVL